MAAKEKALADMSDEEFMDSWTALGDEVTKGRERLKEYSQEHQRRTAQEQLAARLGTLSDPERAALAQYVEAQGVESAEAVSTDG